MRRTTELGRPVDTSGEIMDSGDPALDGPVKDAQEMIHKISRSDRGVAMSSASGWGATRP